MGGEPTSALEAPAGDADMERVENDALAAAAEALEQGRYDDALAFLREAVAQIRGADAEAAVAEALDIARGIPGDEARRFAEQLQGAQSAAAPSHPLEALFFLVLVIGVGLVVLLQTVDRFRPLPTPGESDFAAASIPGSAPVLSGARVYLAPIGRFEAVEPERLAAGLERDYGIRVDVLPRIAPPQPAYDPARKQLDADLLLGLLGVHYPTGSPDTAVIGLTDFDLFCSCEPDFRFMFSLRAPAGYAVVSAARMRPSLVERVLRRDPEDARVRKMVERNVAQLAFGLPLGADGSSVLRREIRSVADIDAMESGIPLGAPPRR